jgi:hypothetical protein
MENISTPDAGVLSLSMPQREGKAGYLASFLIARNEIVLIIKSSSGNVNNDHRIRLAVKALIMFIDDDDYRRDLYKTFNARVAEILSSSGSADLKADQIMDESLFIIGEVTSYFDRCIGLSHRLEARLL